MRQITATRSLSSPKFSGAVAPLRNGPTCVGRGSERYEQEPPSTDHYRIPDHGCHCGRRSAGEHVQTGPAGRAAAVQRPDIPSMVAQAESDEPGSDDAG